MSLLNIQNLTYHIGDKTLYQNAHFVLLPGEHVGITGANGVGKTTLLRLLQSELLPDAGKIEWQPLVKVGYLDQHAQLNPALSVREHLRQAFSELYELEAQMMAIYSCPEKSVALNYLNQAAEIQTKLESESFYTLDNRIEAVADGLGINAFGMETRLADLSGGQRHKVLLAQLLLIAPKVLLLDEPTNYLDHSHIQWLTEYLQHFAGAFMVVSHDQHFLNDVTTHICDIDKQSIRKFKGNVAKAMAQKTKDEATYIKQHQAQQKHIEKLESFIAKNGAGVNASIANGRKKQLNRIERMVAPELRKPMSLSFLQSGLSASEGLKADQLGIGYSHLLLPRLSLTIHRGEKVAILGFNGVGKSTLLKTLIGELPPLMGKVDIAHGVKLGYFSQELAWHDPQMTPVNIIKAASATLDDKSARQKLAAVGIGGKLALQPIASLSGGEQTKVKLCALALKPTNILVLDEPTTHLDIEVKAVLQQALINYSGAIIVVSHEPSFVQGWPDRVIDIQQLNTPQI